MEANAPDAPTDLGKRSWWQVLKRAVVAFKADNLTDWAAALTYYAVLSIFPAILALVSTLGLVSSNATQSLLDNLGGIAPGPAKQLLTTIVRSLQGNQSSASIAFVIGIAVALWSASGYVAAFMRASNAVYEMPEGRPIWKTLPVRIGVTAAVVVLLAVSALAVVFTGSLAAKAGQALGLGSEAVLVWNIAKWPVLLLIVLSVFALLYWAAPNVKHPGFRWVTPGSAVGVVTWILASAAFGFYIANFAHYNKTYGALAGVVIFLIWLWISNIAILLGVEL
ncbi:MAG: YihY/virulence factor BrkB family protein, partial [Streptosporangiales bacterium]|nr:YihY/virulence factor BrkB family protein [Streptosporangiales bacterium]